MRFVALFVALFSMVVSCAAPAARGIVVTATSTPPVIVVTATPPVATATLPLPLVISSLTPLPTPQPYIDATLANKIRALGCITFIEAEAYIGQSKCVGGIVVAVFQDVGSSTFFMNFDGARTGFYAVSFKERYDNLEGKCVIIIGKIDRFGGRPQIIVNDRTQIRLCD